MPRTATFLRRPELNDVAAVTAPSNSNPDLAFFGRIEQPMPRRTTKSAGPDPVDIAVGKRVRLRRLQLGMSQTELADKLGVTFQQVQKYEKGTNRISCSRLSEMAEALDFPITSFFSDENKPLTEMTVTENLDPGHMKDGLRLITAFGQIEKTQRKMLLAMVESMVQVDR
jgi:transcriptional regulator with XRE-family HTH domain